MGNRQEKNKEMVDSRTNKSLKNVRIALSFYFINIIINFFSRKVFIDYLGTDILGLNTTAVNLLSLLNIAELGIGFAVSFTLYKPLFEQERQKICEIVSVQGWFYRRIAFFVVIASIILMFFFPFFFEKSGLPLWYAYATFLVLLSNALFSYIFNYKQVVLIADQKEYKITLNIQGFKFLKTLLQIIAIIYLEHGYIYWLVLEFMMAVASVAILSKVIRTEYPWLKINVSQGKIFKDKYPQIIRKTKELFFHKIGDLVLSQTSPLIIYGYATFTLVAVYGNYMLLITGITLFVNSIFNSLIAGVGSLVAEGNKKNINLVFKELFASRMWIGFVVCFCMYQLSESFISLWVGSEYILDSLPFRLLVLYTFINLTRIAEIFTPAYGLYQDVWAPLIEAIINLGLSIWLGYYWGLSGILSGVIISLVIIIVIWKPFFLFKKGLCESPWHYFLPYFKYLILGVCSCFLAMYACRFIATIPDKSYLNWFYYSVQTVTIFILISFPLFYLSSYGMRAFFGRIVKLISLRTKK